MLCSTLNGIQTQRHCGSTSLIFMATQLNIACIGISVVGAPEFSTGLIAKCIAQAEIKASS
jgi:hypothetical protein